MARLPRLYAPGCPIGASQFHPALAAPSQPAPADILNQLATWLGESAQRHRVSVHAWLLANDRILLLATPADEEGLPRLMQTLGRNLAARLRGGRVFAGRYRSALLEPGAWVLPSQVWLETYPVRSGASQDPDSWPGPRPAAIPATPTRRPRNGSRTTPITGPAAIRRSTARPTTASACRTACRARKPNASTRRCLASGRWAAPASSPAWPTPPAAGSRRDSADVRARNQPRPRQPGTLLKRRPRL